VVKPKRQRALGVFVSDDESPSLLADLRRRGKRKRNAPILRRRLSQLARANNFFTIGERDSSTPSLPIPSGHVAVTEKANSAPASTASAAPP